jgi:flagellar biosynthesis/type III secretory pathway M-ring protein FliF/YscJ
MTAIFSSYTNLAAEDAGAVMKLKEEGVEYRVDDNGTALRVPLIK